MINKKLVKCLVYKNKMRLNSYLNKRNIRNNIIVQRENNVNNYNKKLYNEE